MSSVITPVSITRFEKFLVFIGCQFKRQKGSHRVWRRAGLKRPLILPKHGKEIDPFIIRKNLDTLNIDANEYLRIMADL
jgi:predicted RNA binding protein YcfA (HicA-like mRNA interferase family)